MSGCAPIRLRLTSGATRLHFVSVFVRLRRDLPSLDYGTAGELAWQAITRCQKGVQAALIRLRATTARQGNHGYRLKSGGYFAVRCLRTRRRNRFSRTAQTVEVEFNGVVHFAFDGVSRLARGDAAGEIGRIGGIAGRSFFNDNQVPTHFNPACLRIIFCVPGARSSLGFPAIMSTPFFLIMPILPVATARSIQIPTILL